MSHIDISCEFFPPRDDQGIKRLLANVVPKLAELEPKYFSVTYGAGGSTREGTRSCVQQLIEQGYAASPHLSLGMDDKTSITELLDDYAAMGVTQIVTLRGEHHPEESIYAGIVRREPGAATDLMWHEQVALDVPAWPRE